jgi:glycosyltransferase involved in cell wall biosynthesis
MHVLLIHSYFLPSGAAGSVRWNETVRHWIAAGHQVTVIAGSIDYLTGKPFAEEERIIDGPLNSSPRVLRVQVTDTYNKGRRGRLRAYWTFFWRSLWVGLFKLEKQVDIIIATSPPLTAGLTGWLIAWRYQKPLVLEIRDLWPDAPVQMGYLQNPLLTKLGYWLERFLYYQATHIVTLTTAFEQVLITQKGVSEHRCTTITNGADVSLTNAALANFDRSLFRQANGLDDRFWIVYAGAHGPANGLKVILDIAQSLQREPIGFLLIGEGPEKASLQAEATQQALPNVRFLSAMPKVEVLRWVAAADVGLVVMQPLPVFKTMLSAKLFDYLACGKPVFTAIDGLTRQLDEQYQFGQFVDYQCQNSWHIPIQVYLNSPSLVSEHGKNGQDYVRQHADRAALAHRYLNILNRVHALHQTRP